MATDTAPAMITAARPEITSLASSAAPPQTKLAPGAALRPVEKKLPPGLAVLLALLLSLGLWAAIAWLVHWSIN